MTHQTSKCALSWEELREHLKDFYFFFLCRLAETWEDSNYKQGDKHGSGKSYPSKEALQQPELQLTKLYVISRLTKTSDVVHVSQVTTADSK